MKEAEDPQHELESAVFDFVHDLDIPEARKELQDSLNIVVELAIKARAEPDKPRLQMNGRMFSIMERFKKPQYVPYVNRVRRAVRHMIAMGEMEKKMRESR